MEAMRDDQDNPVVVLNVVEMVEEENGQDSDVDHPVLSDGEIKLDERKEEVVEIAQEETKQLKRSVRLDFLENEACNVSGLASKKSNSTKAASVACVMQLAFQSIGVVYGDIGTSPLYVFSSTFSGRIPTQNNILGALSLIIYSLTLFPLLKYVFIVLRANDNGDGGTLAMYSLICRRVGAVPDPQDEGDEEPKFSAHKLTIPNKNLQRADNIKEAMRSSATKTCLLVAALIGTCMVIGDGILTPCISVLSAVDGVRKIDSNLSKDVVVMTSVSILILLFSIQRFGTDKIGYTFAPAILIWYLLIGIIGIFNLVKHESAVVKAFNPIYICRYFNEDSKQAWTSLGGIVLCMTGTEAMFADLGHFSVRSIQIAFTGLVYPCLVCAYVGQAAYLSKFPNYVSDAFYKSTPDRVYWPVFTAAVLASIIASQAMISATFSIVKQSMALGCFPRVRVVHTSNKHEGQVYIPEINWLLMLACLLVTVGFKDTTKIGNAYGIAVVAVMLVTTSLLVLIMLMIWQTNLLLIGIFVLAFGSFELVFFSSVLYKFDKGGYLPLSIAGCLFFVMYVWHYVQSKRVKFEAEMEVSTIQYLDTLSSEPGITRVPGIGIFYTESTQGVPAIFLHLIKNLPAIHSVLVLVSIKSLHVSRVLEDERFLFARVGPKEHNIYRCIARYGYRDTRSVNEEFENLLIEHLKSFIRSEYMEMASVNEHTEGICSQAAQTEEDDRIQFIDNSRRSGVVYLLGHSFIKAGDDSCVVKKLVVNYAYNFIRRNFRQELADLQFPSKHSLEVGMSYHI